MLHNEFVVLLENQFDRSLVDFLKDLRLLRQRDIKELAVYLSGNWLEFVVIYFRNQQLSLDFWKRDGFRIETTIEEVSKGTSCEGAKS